MSIYAAPFIEDRTLEAAVVRTMDALVLNESPEDHSRLWDEAMEVLGARRFHFLRFLSRKRATMRALQAKTLALFIRALIRKDARGAEHALLAAFVDDDTSTLVPRAQIVAGTRGGHSPPEGRTGLFHLTT